MAKYKQLLDFRYTCSEIDSEISHAKDYIYNNLISIIKEVSTNYTDEEIESIAKENSEIIYKDISECFETVRKLNEDIRETANIQLSDYENQISDLNDTIKALENSL